MKIHPIPAHLQASKNNPGGKEMTKEHQQLAVNRMEDTQLKEVSSTINKAEETIVNSGSCCSACTEHHDALFYCHDCKEYFCEIVARVHQQMKATHHHRIQPVISSAPSSLLCPIHQDLWRYYDTTCNQLICSHCIVSEDHAGHTCISIPTARKSLAAELETRMDLEKEKLIRLQVLNEQLEAHARQCDLQYHSLCDTITTHYAEVSEALQSHQTNTFLVLEQLHDQTKGNLQSEQEHIRAQLEATQAFLLNHNNSDNTDNNENNDRQGIVDMKAVLELSQRMEKSVIGSTELEVSTKMKTAEEEQVVQEVIRWKAQVLQSITNANNSNSSSSSNQSQAPRTTHTTTHSNSSNSTNNNTADTFHLISGSGDATIKFWHLPSSNNTNNITDSNSGNTTATATATVTGNETSSCCVETITGGHTARIRALLQWNAHLLCTASDDHSIKFWQVKQKKKKDTNKENGYDYCCVGTISEHTAAVYSIIKLCYNGDQKGEYQLCSASFDNAIKVYDITITTAKDDTNNASDTTIVAAQGKCVKTLLGHVNWVFAIAELPPGSGSSSLHRLVSASCDQTIKLWDLDLGVCLQTLLGHQNAVFSVIPLFYNQETTARYLCSGAEDTTLKIWDLSGSNNTSTCVHTFLGHNHRITSLIQLQYMQYICSTSCDHTIRLWCFAAENEEASGCMQVLRGHTHYVYSVLELTGKEGDCEGGRLCSGSADQTIRLWHIASGNCLRILLGHTQSVCTLLRWEDNSITSEEEEEAQDLKE